MGVHLSRTYALRWDAGDLADVEIDIKSTSVATMREMRSLRTGQEDGELRLTEILAAHIKRWNLEDEDGQALPVSVDSLLGLEPAVLAAIGREWYLATAGVSAPLDLGSINTPPSAEESIPMEEL